VFSWLAPSVELASQADLRAGLKRAPQLVATEWQLHHYMVGLINSPTPENAFLLDALKALRAGTFEQRHDLAEKPRRRHADDVAFANFNALLQGATINLESLISHGAQRLIEDVDLRRRVEDDDVTMAQLTKEVGRTVSPLRMAFRITEQDVDFGDLVIPAHRRVVVLLHEANHDPSVFPRPDEFLPDRWKRNGQPDGALALDDALTLGDGVHRCIGGPLTMLEASLAWQALMVLAERLQVAEFKPQRRPGIAVHALERIPVIASPAS
jgi:cytochrome P450